MNQTKRENIEELAVKIQQSKKQAFNEFFRLLYPQLVQYAISYTKDKSSAGDIVQDSFLSLWQNRNNIDPEKSLKAYMYMIVRNRAINYLRNHSVEITKPDLEIENTVLTEEQAESGQRATMLSEKFREWIDELPERRQEAFELSRFDGLSHQEIATVMEVSIKTVNNHIVAAIKQLKNQYNQYQQELDRT